MSAIQTPETEPTEATQPSKRGRRVGAGITALVLTVGGAIGIGHAIDERDAQKPTEAAKTTIEVKQPTTATPEEVVAPIDAALTAKAEQEIIDAQVEAAVTEQENKPEFEDPIAPPPPPAPSGVGEASGAVAVEKDPDGTIRNVAPGTVPPQISGPDTGEVHGEPPVKLPDGVE